MKLSAQEEYGLRCLLRVARAGEGESLTIPEIGRAEALSIPYVAKLMRILRQGKFVKSVRGQTDGYTLARGADDIPVGEVLAALGGQCSSPGSAISSPASNGSAPIPLIAPSGRCGAQYRRP